MVFDTQEESQLKIKGKLQEFIQKKQEVIKELEEKQMKVQSTQESTLKKKQELLTMKQFKEQLVKEMLTQNDEELKKKNEVIKDISDKVQAIKNEAKVEREKRRQIEEHLEILEEERTQLKHQLGDYDKKALEMSNLDHTQADLEKEKASQLRLSDRVKELKKSLEEAQRKSQEIKTNESTIQQEKEQQNNLRKKLQNPENSNSEELSQRLEKVKNENKALFDANLKYIASLNDIAVQLQFQESKKIELTEIANLLKDQNQFEKLSRKLQIKVENIEDQQRFQEDSYKELQAALKQIEQEIEVKNEGLEKELKSFKKSLDSCVQDKDELSENIKVIMSKVCNKKPQELKIDQIDQNLKSLLSHGSSIEEIGKRSLGLKQTIQELIRKYFEYESSLKNDYYNKSSNLIKDNDLLISGIGTNLTQVQEQIIKLENKIKSKEAIPDTDDQMIVIDQIKSTVQATKVASKDILNDLDNEKKKLYEIQDHHKLNQTLLTSQAQEKTSLERVECSIGEFVGLYREISEQNDRLSKVLVKRLNDDLEQKVTECQTHLEDFIKDKTNRKQDKCNRDINEGQVLSKLLDDKIHQLEDRLAMLNQNCEKADPDDKEQIREKIDKVQRDLGKMKDQKKQLDKELNKIQASTNDDKSLLDKKQKEIDNIINALDTLINSDIKDKEGSIDRIEEDLRDAIRKRRKQNREKCMNVYDQANKGMKDLNNQLDQIKNSIQNVEDKIGQFQRMYNYPDLERTQEQNEELVNKIEEEKQKYQQMNKDKQQLQGNVNNLQKEVEKIQSLILGYPTLTPADQKSDPINDEIVSKWDDCAQKSKQVLKEIQEGQRKASMIQDEVDTIHQVSDELMEKYKQKNKLYGECKTRKKELDDKTKEICKDIGDLENGTLSQISTLLNKIVAPKNNKEFANQYRNKMKELENQQAKTKEQKAKIEEIQNNLNEIESRLDIIGKEIVVTPELQEIKNSLDKLKLEFNYQKDQLQNLEFESQELLQEAKDLEEKNKQILEQEAEATHDLLTKDLANLDILDQETSDLLNQYNNLIDKGLKFDDREVQSHMSNLKEESKNIEKHLNQMKKQKDKLSGQEKQYRQSLKECKMDLKNTNPHKLQELNNQFEEISEQQKGVQEGFKQSKDDIEERIKQLQDYLSKYNKLQSMFSSLNKKLSKAKRTYHDLNNSITKSEISSSLIKEVLDEMQKGTKSDYKNKADFINEKQKELESIDKTIKKLREHRNDIDVKMEEIKFKETGLNDMNQGEITELTLYSQKTQESMQQALEEAQSNQGQLNQMKSDIGEADLQRLFKLRESGLETFTQALKQVEQQFQEVKRNINSNQSLENHQEFESELKEIDSKLQVFRELRVQFKRELGEDLHKNIIEKRDQLKDLKVLRECIEKVVGMGFTMDESLDMLKQLQLLTERVKRQVQGFDLMKRLNDLKNIENNERERLLIVNARLKRINKGANECDGYTSNSEESTFIETLLGELPEIEDKEKQASSDCDKVNDSLSKLKKVLDSVSDKDEDNQNTQNILSNMDHVESQLEKNDKTIVFLEKLVLKLETHFIEMDVKRKLEKRSMELNELESICDDFNNQLQDLETHLMEDIQKLELNKKLQGSVVMNMFVDEDGKPVNLLEEICQVQDELKQVFQDVNLLQEESQHVTQKREDVIRDLHEKVLSRSPFKSTGSGKVTSVDDVFILLKQNGVMKKKIIDLIKSLKAIRNKMKDHKSRYQNIRLKIEKQNKPKKYYKAIKGDLVDELFAEYINKLNCPVPITRLGNNQYTFGTRKIFAKVINGKLVIRVGGGYMGIEEFMMYYGEQELTRLQKQEGFSMDDETIGILDDNATISDHDEFGGGGGTGDNMGSGRKSSRERVTDIDLIKEKVRQQSAQKQRVRSPYKAIDKEEEKAAFKDDGRTQIIGLGDVRKALKQNLVEIKTYQENIQVGHHFTPMGKDKSKGGLSSSKMISDPNALQIEKHLRNVERRVGDKLKQSAQKQDLLSPGVKKVKKSNETIAMKSINSSLTQKQAVQSKSMQQDVSRKSIQSEKGPIGMRKSDITKSPANQHKKIRISSPIKKQLQ